MNFALNGSEVQVEGFAWVIHADMDVEEELPKIRKRLEKCFEKETAHKITRVLMRDTAASFFTQAGNEEHHYNEVLKYVKELATSRRFPIDLRFMNYVSYTPLQVVSG